MSFRLLMRAHNALALAWLVPAILLILAVIGLEITWILHNFGVIKLY